jgi:hypothetical protein
MEEARLFSGFKVAAAMHTEADKIEQLTRLN